MGESVLEQRGRALEDAFFARQDQDLLERMRRAERAASRKQAMAAATGVTDDALLKAWIALNLGPETVAALALVPLVLVAWADGTLDAREAAALRDAAHETGLDRRSDAAALLEAWLAAPPPRRMEQAWRDYAHSLAAGLEPAARAALRAETIGRARRVAEAAGGFLGLGNRVSAAEEAVLAGLDAAFG
jgi:hypothetical protein